MPVATGNGSATSAIALNNAVLKIDGVALSQARASELISVEVEAVLGRPDLCTIRFHVDITGAEPTADTRWKIGAKLQVSMGGEQVESVFAGEITSVELDWSHTGTSELTVVACDKRHRLFRVEKTRTLQQVKIADVLSKIAGEAGISSGGDGGVSATVHPFLFQQAQTDGDFLDALIRPLGYVTMIDGAAGDSVKLVKLSGLTTESATLELGVDLLAFSCTKTSDGETDQVEVRGWDLKKKEAIVGTGAGSLADSLHRITSNPAASGFPKPKVGQIGLRVDATADATAQATGIALEQGDGRLRMRATCHGNPKIQAGTTITMKGVGPFNGKYRVSTVRHLYSLERGYECEISSHGTAEDNVTGVLRQAVLGGDQQPARRSPVLLQAIVTNAKPPGDVGDMGLVKVKVPTFGMNEGKDFESGWLRLVQPNAGNGYGWYTLPEVNDEVLVVFEDDTLHRGYVLGGVYNGKDAPPRKNADLIGGDGKVKQRLFRSRTGHELVFDDSDDKPQVLIKTGNKKLSILLDDKEDKIVIDSDGEVLVKAAKKMNLEATDDLTIKGKNITIEAQSNVKINANSNVEIEGKAKSSVKGAQVEVDGTGQTKVHGAQLQLAGDAMAELKAAMVKIN